MSGPPPLGRRQSGALDPAFEAFNRSLPFDRRLVDEDLVGSLAWARALGGAGCWRRADVDALVAALAELRDEVAADPERLAASPAEDVHAFVESALGEKVGDLAKRLHTGRSRNDQVATDVRLFLRAEAKDLDGCIRQLVAELVALAEREAATPLPGYTHLRRAQPITAGHHALCYAEMLYRDAGRLCDAAARLDESPLGCGALAGTAFPVDREALAADLGFGRAAHNSLDAVASRDGILEVIFACTTALVTLSRLAEDWIFFASQEAGFLTMGDEVTTGSSLMPQKKNPDALELIRGKCARVIGHLDGVGLAPEGPAARVRQGPAGGQGGAVRRPRHDARLPDRDRDLRADRPLPRGPLPAACATGTWTPPTWPTCWWPGTCPSAMRTTRWAPRWPPPRARRVLPTSPPRCAPSTCPARRPGPRCRAVRGLDPGAPCCPRGTAPSRVRAGGPMEDRAAVVDRVTLRPAVVGDVELILDLVNDLAAAGEMLPCSPSTTVERLRDFVVAEVDGEFAGCRRPWPSCGPTSPRCARSRSAEARGLGVGRRMAEFLLDGGQAPRRGPGDGLHLRDRLLPEARLRGGRP